MPRAKNSELPISSKPYQMSFAWIPTPISKVPQPRRYDIPRTKQTFNEKESYFLAITAMPPYGTKKKGFEVKSYTILWDRIVDREKPHPEPHCDIVHKDQGGVSVCTNHNRRALKRTLANRTDIRGRSKWSIRIQRRFQENQM